MFEPVQRQSLSQSVYERLRDGIVSGELGSGTKLPSERELAETLKVNRGAVREALKRLEQARLVSVRHGGAAQVRDYLGSAGLDLLSELLFADDQLNMGVARSVIEMRACLGPEIARRAAERGGQEAVGRLEAVLESMRLAGDDLDRLQELSMDFWTELVAASENVAYRLAFNSLHLAYGKFRHLLLQVLAAELQSADLFQAVVEAVRCADGEAAQQNAGELLNRGAEQLLAMLAILEAAGHDTEDDS